jgi:hypothetical protein
VSWVNRVWVTATAATIAVLAILNGFFGVRWYAFAIGPPVFFVVSVAIPLCLGVLDRRKETLERDDRRARKPIYFPAAKKQRM